MGRKLDGRAVPWPRSLRSGSVGERAETDEGTEEDAEGVLPSLLRSFGNSRRRGASEPVRQLSTTEGFPVKALLTAYCACAICCGRAGGLTAANTKPVPGVTLAAPRSVPFGMWVTVEAPGIGRIRRRVEDRTARRFDGRWDLFVATHEEAERFGKRWVTVRIER